MALFMDGMPSDIEDLTNQDSGLLEVCRTLQIDVSAKMKLAEDEMAADLEGMFEQQRPLITTLFVPVRRDLFHLVVTPQLKAWHTLHTLSLVYRDAYFNQLNDRFQAKWNEFRNVSQIARDRLRELGAGLVTDPIARPEPPVLTATASTQMQGTVYVAVTVVNGSSEESAPSVLGSVSSPDENGIQVQLVSRAANAQGWNVYGGSSPGALYLQSGSPLPIDQTNFLLALPLASCGKTPGMGQAPNVFRTLPRRWQRG
jgi:hypothetical protein